jgi:hypothetical protein
VCNIPQEENKQKRTEELVEEPQKRNRNLNVDVDRAVESWHERWKSPSKRDRSKSIQKLTRQSNLPTSASWESKSEWNPKHTPRSPESQCLLASIDDARKSYPSRSRNRSWASRAMHCDQCSPVFAMDAKQFNNPPD